MSILCDEWRGRRSKWGILLCVAIAPRVGARIETRELESKGYQSIIAPFAGARIETDIIIFLGGKIIIAPFVGARIETD